MFDIKIYRKNRYYTCVRKRQFKFNSAKRSMVHLHLQYQQFGTIPFENLRKQFIKVQKTRNSNKSYDFLRTNYM